MTAPGAGPRAPEGTPLGWTRREPPLPAAAVTARPEDTPALIEATARRLRSGSPLRVAAGDTAVIVLAVDGAELPWFPGAVYLGWDDGLLTPTHRAPRPAAGLLLASLRGAVPADHRLVAVVPWAVLAAPMPARPADPDALPPTVPPDPR